MTFLETSLVILAEASLALQVEKLWVSRWKLQYGRKTVYHIFRGIIVKPVVSNRSCDKFINDDFKRYLSYTLLYMKAVDTLKVVFLWFCSLNKCPHFLTDFSPVWRVISEGKMDLIRFRLTIKNSNFLFKFGPKKKKREREGEMLVYKTDTIVLFLCCHLSSSWSICFGKKKQGSLPSFFS